MNTSLVKRRRYYDRAIRSIRHNDGIKDIALKIKEKATALASKLKNSESGRKAAVVLLKIVKWLSRFYAAKTSYDAIKSYKEIKHLRNDLDTIEMEMDKDGTYVEKSASSQLSRAGLRVISSLLLSFIASVSEKSLEAKFEAE